MNDSRQVDEDQVLDGEKGGPAVSPGQNLSLAAALDLWVGLSDVDPSRKSFTFGDLSVLDMHHALKEALDLDDSEITGLLFFQYVVNEYFQERSFSVAELIKNPDRVSTYLGKSKELLGYLERPELKAVGNEFCANVSAAVASYGAKGDAMDALLGSPHRLAILRRDAFRTMRKLSVHQFLCGESEPEGFRPVYGKFVYRWMNINSMIHAMVDMPSGITVNLIEHPTNSYHSYFAFAIRNGANLFVFTDKESSPHPLADNLRRRPDRVLAARSERNWFPYELMGLQIDEDGNAVVVQSEGRVLARHQDKLQPIKPLAALDECCVVWLSMMFDLIVEKFWRHGYKASALSYTGEMVKINSPLLEKAHSSTLAVAGYAPLVVNEITLSDVATSEENKGKFGKSGHGANLWLELRYGQRVSEDTFNLVAPPDEYLALSYADQSSFVSEPKFTLANAVLPKVISSPNESDFKSNSFFGSSTPRPVLALDRLDSTSFGTKESIEADRLFLARSNYAKYIGRLAAEEFNERTLHVQYWVRNRITENIPNLYPMATSDEILVHAQKRHAFDVGAGGWSGQTEDGYKRSFATRVGIAGENAWRKKDLYTGQGRFHFSSGGYKDGAPTCLMTGGPASYMVTFLPERADELAFLCGCEVSDLPDVLQHWTRVKKYVGNNISDRVDPMEWQCVDPWKELRFECRLFFSIRAMKHLEKQYPPNSFDCATLSFNQKEQQ